MTQKFQTDFYFLLIINNEQRAFVFGIFVTTKENDIYFISFYIKLIRNLDGNKISHMEENEKSLMNFAFSNFLVQFHIKLQNIMFSYKQ